MLNSKGDKYVFKNRIVKTSVIAFLVLSIAVACNKGPSPEEELFTILEKVVVLEEPFQEQQAPLVELEQKETKIYDQIISLGMKEFDQIVSLSEEALSILEERESRIEKEYESIQASKKQFGLVKNSIDNIGDLELKEEANRLFNIMNNRYSAYEELYNSYTESLELDRQLYEMFQNENLTIDELEEQIKKSNESYDEIIQANDQFNTYTEQYNEAKVAFYKNADLDVVFEEEAEGK